MRYSNNPLELVFVFFRYHKLAGKLCVLCVLVFALFICWKVGIAHEATRPDHLEIPSTEEEIQGDFPYIAITQLDQETELTTPVDINFSQAQDYYEITTGGQFHLTGELGGTLFINAKEQNVHLFLDNVSITSKSGPAIYCQDADKLVITVMSDTENIISDLGDYRADEKVESCIYSECDMTINGTGKLTVNGYYKDAIRSKDIVKILDGVYTIKCKRTGIHGNDGLLIAGGKITISSEKYGLKTANSGAEGRGNMIISGGSLSIIAGRYAFVTTKANLIIYNCSISVNSVVNTYDVGGMQRIQEGCVQ